VAISGLQTGRIMAIIEAATRSSTAQPVGMNPWYLYETRVPAHIPKYLGDRLAQFLEDGYVVLQNSVSTETCDLVRDEFWKLAKANPRLFDKHKDTDGHFPRLINLHAIMPSLLKLFYENKAALELQDALFGEETVLYTSLFYERGSWQDLHRDTPYFATRPEYKYFGMWVALEDVDETNGPLMVAPGGHLLKELDREAVARDLYSDLNSIPADSPELWERYQSAVGRQVAAAGIKTISVPVKKGSTIIWHPHLPHGGSPIEDLTRTRLSLVIHTTPRDTPVYHQDVFFHPSKDFPTKAPWRTDPAGGRRYVPRYTMSFGHSDPHPASDFNGLGRLTPHTAIDRMIRFVEKARRRLVK